MNKTKKFITTILTFCLIVCGTLLLSACGKKNVKIAFTYPTEVTATENERTIASGSVIGALPTADKNGYSLVWYEDNAYTVIVSAESKFSKNTTLYSQFVANNYTIHFDANGGTGTMDDMKVTFDKSFKLSSVAFENQGYSFQDWSFGKTEGTDDLADASEIANYTYSHDITLFAIWKVNIYRFDVDFVINDVNGTKTLYLRAFDDKLYTDSDCTKVITTSDYPTSDSYDFSYYAVTASGKTSCILFKNGATTLYKNTEDSTFTTADGKWNYFEGDAKIHAIYIGKIITLNVKNVDSTTSKYYVRIGSPRIYTDSTLTNQLILTPSKTGYVLGLYVVGDDKDYLIYDSLKTTTYVTGSIKIGGAETLVTGDGTGFWYCPKALTIIAKETPARVRFVIESNGGGMSCYGYYGLSQLYIDDSYSTSMTKISNANISKVLPIKNGCVNYLEFSYKGKTFYSLDSDKFVGEQLVDSSFNLSVTSGGPYVLFPTAYFGIVNYNPNNGDGVAAYVQTVERDATTSTYTFELRNNGFTRAGYTFAGWNTKADGSGTAYASGASVVWSESPTFYAQWTANKYKIHFDKNDDSATGTMEDLEVTTGKEFTLPDNAFSKTGYEISKWSFTATDGDGQYLDDGYYGESYDYAKDLTLYVIWIKSAYYVIFNFGVYTSLYMDSVTVEYQGTITLPACDQTVPGYTFRGWATTEDGAVVYNNEASFTMNGAEDVNLYAVYGANQKTIKFINPNDGTYIITNTTTYKDSLIVVTGVTATAIVIPTFDDGVGEETYTFNGIWTTADGGTQIIDANGNWIKNTNFVDADGKFIITDTALLNLYLHVSVNEG